MLKLELKSARTVNRGRGTINHLPGRSSRFCNGELFYNEDGGLYRISKADIENWQKTDKFTFSRIAVKGDEMFYRDLEEINDVLAGTDEDDNRVYYITTYDPDAHTLTSDARYDWNFYSNGYIVRNVIKGTSLDIVIAHPSGRQTITNVPVAVYKDANRFRLGSWECHGLNVEGYVAWVFYEEKSQRNVTETDEDDDCTMVFETSQYNLSLVKTDGTLECVWKYSVNPAISKIEMDSIAHFSLIHIVENNYYSGYQKVWIYDPTEKTLKEMGVPEMAEGVLDSNGEIVYDNEQTGDISRNSLIYFTDETATHAIMYDFITNEDGRRHRSPKFLATIDGTRVSGNYPEIFTKDYEMFLVKTADGKWGYIDKTGKLLGVFDDAGEFDGEYAPVMNNGKAFLINRKMEQVSECIGADYVLTICDGLYKIRQNGRQFFMTYK